MATLHDTTDMESLIIERLQQVVDVTDIDESNLTPIQNFYKGANVFITGATGFLGQILIEKLLRSCPVSTVYLMVRNKKGKNMDTRLKEIVSDQLFVGLKKIFPEFHKKLVIVEGDCALPGLGLSDQDKKLLLDEVNIIFHAAATVRFDEKLKSAVAINVRAIKDLSQLAQQMPNLKSFLQVSTAFVNCIYDTMEERIYTAPIQYRYMIDIAEKLDSCLLDNLTPYFIGKYPNTYVYTKHIAEDVLKHETRGIATGIYRPSIVVSTYREPVRGWINNIYGATGVFFGAGIGLLKVLYCDGSTPANMVPVDMCVNGLIAAAWDVSEKFKNAKVKNEEYEVPVYNYESTNDQPITWDGFKRLSAKYGILIPSVKCVWVYFIFLVKSYRLYQVMAFFLHLVPGLIADTILYCRGEKTRLVKVYKKIYNFSSLISYFSVRTFIFKSVNVQRMLSYMSDRDRQIFFCDLKLLDWDEFFTTYGPGARIYMAKDPIETLPKAKQQMQKFTWYHRIVVTVTGLLASMTLWLITSAIYKHIISRIFELR